MLLTNILRCSTRRGLQKLVDKSDVRTAGVIIIGDEILKGDVCDTNSRYLVKKLYQFGVRVKKISVISDDVDQISEEVQYFSNNYTYVITSGGIGPTHDDVTFEAVGKAFNEELVPHPILVNICSKFYETNDLRSPGMKLAHIPKSAKLTFGEAVNGRTSYPSISIKNVHLFPGIPLLFKTLFDQVGHKLFVSNEKFYTKVVFFNVAEKSIVNALNRVVKTFPQVVFGSYPEMENSIYKVKITMECTDEAQVTAAYNKLLELVPKEYVVDHTE